MLLTLLVSLRVTAQSYTAYFVSKDKIIIRDGKKQKARFNKDVEPKSLIKISFKGTLTIRGKTDHKVYVVKTPTSGFVENLISNIKTYTIKDKDKKLAKLAVQSTVMQTEGAVHRGPMTIDEKFITMVSE